jgi:hypothetical protein
MKPEYQIAIEALQREVAEFERKAAEARATVNRLCEYAGAALIYPPAKEAPGFGSGGKAIYAEESHVSGRPILRRKRQHHINVKKARPSVRPFILSVMKDASEWTTRRLKEEAIKQNVPGIDDSTPRNVFQGTLLALLQAREVEQTETGSWRVTSSDQPRRGEIVSIKGAA